LKLSTKKILQWSIWPILALVFFGTYFLLPGEEDEKHLELIPSNTNFVVLANPLVVLKTYARMLEEDPSIFIDFELELDNEELDERVKDGINPLKKIAIYQFESSSNSFEGFGLLACTDNFDSFIKFFNKRDNKDAPTSFDSGKYLIVPKDEEFYLFKDGVAVRIIAKASVITEEIVKECFNDIFNAKTHLVDLEPTFKNQLSANDQLTYWSSAGNNIVEHFNPQLGVMSNLFDRKNVAINITPAGFEIDAMLELQDENSIVDRVEPVDLELLGTECFRFSASVNPSQFGNFFDLIIPEDKKYLITDWNGGISASIDGFRNISIKKIKKEGDPGITFKDSLYPFKTVEEDLIDIKIPLANGGIDDLFSYPYFTVACELKNIDNVKAAIDLDSTISNVGSYYSFILPGYVVNNGEEKKQQRVYFYFTDNSMVFSPELPEQQFVPQYNNFGMLFKFDPFYENYEYKSMMGDFVLSQMEDFQFNGIAVEYVKTENGFVKLKGIFDLKNTDNHLIGFPLLLKKISDMPFISSLPVAF
jgi:hypothetical protein